MGFVMGALTGLLLLLALFNEFLKVRDNREPYLRDSTGRALALYLAGPIGRGPNHEAYSHDGTPHQDPVNYTKIKWGWFDHEYWLHSYYPLTVAPDGRRASTVYLETLIENNPPKTGTVEIRPMPGWVIKRARRVEDGTQRKRGVFDGDLVTGPLKALERFTAPLFWFGLLTFISLIAFAGLAYAY